MHCRIPNNHLRFLINISLILSSYYLYKKPGNFENTLSLFCLPVASKDPFISLQGKIPGFTEAWKRGGQVLLRTLMESEPLPGGGDRRGKPSSKPSKSWETRQEEKISSAQLSREIKSRGGKLNENERWRPPPSQSCNPPLKERSAKRSKRIKERGSWSVALTQKRIIRQVAARQEFSGVALVR